MSLSSGEPRVVSASDLTLIRMIDVPDRSLSLVERTAHQIETAAAVGLLEPDIRLPREVVLASNLGISAMTLRQVLAEIRNRGMIVTKRGNSGGSFVTSNPAAISNLTITRLNTITGLELQDLTNATASVLVKSCQLASELHLGRDRAKLHSAAEALGAARSSVELRRASLLLHLAIATVARSPRLTNQTLALLTEFNLLRWNSAEPLSDHEFQFCLELVDSILNSDVERSIKLMEMHMRQAGSDINERRLQLVRMGLDHEKN